MSGSTQCPHSDLHYSLHHVGLADTNLHYLEITGHCKICEKKLMFRGAPMGMSLEQPCISPDGQEIRLPFLCEGEEIQGNQIGFAVSRKAIS